MNLVPGRDGLIHISKLGKGKRLPQDGLPDDAFHCFTYGRRALKAWEREEPAPDLRDPTTRLEDEIAMVKRQYIHLKRSSRPVWDR